MVKAMEMFRFPQEGERARRMSDSVRLCVANPLRGGRPESEVRRSVGLRSR